MLTILGLAMPIYCQETQVEKRQEKRGIVGSGIGYGGYGGASGYGGIYAKYPGLYIMILRIDAFI